MRVDGVNSKRKKKRVCKHVICLKVLNIFFINFFCFFCFFVFCIYIKCISAEGYENGGVQFLGVREAGEIGASMKDSGSGMGVKNISHLILKEIHGVLKTKKTPQKSKLRNTK